MHTARPNHDRYFIINIEDAYVKEGYNCNENIASTYWKKHENFEIQSFV